MSAAYDAAVAQLREADDLEALLNGDQVVMADVDGVVEGIKATLALVDEVEAAVELLRERLPAPVDLDPFPDGVRTFKPLTPQEQELGRSHR